MNLNRIADGILMPDDLYNSTRLLIDAARDIITKKQLLYPDAISTRSNVQYLVEFASVTINVGRRAGYTRYIEDHVHDGALVITKFPTQQCQLRNNCIQRGISVEVVEVGNFIHMNGHALLSGDIVFIDDFSANSPQQKADLFRILASRATPPYQVICLG